MVGRCSHHARSTVCAALVAITFVEEPDCAEVSTRCRSRQRMGALWAPLSTQVSEHRNMATPRRFDPRVFVPWMASIAQVAQTV